MFEKTITLENGKGVQVRWREERMKALLPYANYNTELLVRWDPKEHIAIVDVNAPEWYKPLAALHEMICCGREFEELVPNLVVNGLRCEHYCACIEKFCLNAAGIDRTRYAFARREMFFILIEKHLCVDKGMLAQIKRTYDMINTEEI